MSSLVAALALSAALAGTPAGQDATSQPQRPAAVAPPTQLDEILVEGRQLQDLVRGFVDEVAAPTRRRGLARWSRSVCVSVVNLRADAAQYLIDRVSNVALNLGLDVGEPGCRPDIVIIGAVDSTTLATALVDSRRRNFDVGSLQMDRGSSALKAFQTTDRPVRWWQISMPVDSNTGRRAIRLAGDDGAPVISVFAASRLHSQIRDDLVRSLIIFDVDRLGEATFDQLTDYVTLLALAQIDPDAETGGYPTILNLFDDPAATPGLTDWDMSYLKALYEADQTRLNPASHISAVASVMTRDRRAGPADRTD